ncbi:hypothetical protein E5Q_03948 [Mixia osmundae IAM 14324]|uniref:Late embryogenesis abundant protein LEA-2 subgroup domain-containing protein n=2 Tax=Mixia osmundae (strain CBS 9802 / IAM 14324 / JCM 22182 / KY 12970) TaxID=764103 RepID=G7E390_MIXOS|nr:hypothetical protein E5Q_03948 [Mixia osmundae IAM 14324]
MKTAVLAFAALAGLASAAPAPAASKSLAAPNSKSGVAALIGQLKLIDNITVTIPVDTAPTDNLVEASFFVTNGLPNLGLYAETIQFNSLRVSASVNKTVYASFSYTFKPPLQVPGGKTVSSPTIPNVLLTQGFDNSLALLDAFGGPQGYLDLATTASLTVKSSLLFGIIQAPITVTLPYNQKNVTTFFNFE